MLGVAMRRASLKEHRVSRYAFPAQATLEHREAVLRALIFLPAELKASVAHIPAMRASTMRRADLQSY